jgi:hypothetical protein
MHTIRKIDFFGGLHGNYLELVVNHAIDQNDYDITDNQFLDTGACHLKSYSKSYVPITRCGHYSSWQQNFNDHDFVVRITAAPEDMLIAVTNSFLRAGNQMLDIDHLEQDTYHKMFCLPKLRSFLRTLTDRYGIRRSYPRHILRHYFYSMFAVPECGLHMYNRWLPANHFHEFQFSSFFSFEKFYQELQSVANFFNLEFLPSADMIVLHENFLRVNQGWHSHIKCSNIIESIIRQKNIPLDLNIVEESWINWKITQIFNIYDLDCTQKEKFPEETSIIIREIAQHYQERSTC